MLFQDNCITVDWLVEKFPDIEDINYKKIIIVFDELYTNEELEKIYNLLRHTWMVNHLYRLDAHQPHISYEDRHSLIQRQMIFVENCDIDTVDSAYELYEYYQDGYQTYFVCSQITLDKEAMEVSNEN